MTEESMRTEVDHPPQYMRWNEHRLQCCKYLRTGPLSMCRMRATFPIRFSL